VNVIVIGATLLTRACMEEIGQKYNIVALFTLSKESGQKKCRYATFDDLAQFLDFEIFEVDKINTEESIKRIKKLNPDLIIEAGASELISKEIIDIPRLGTIGIHGAILPDERGMASLNWALIRGEEEWGVSLYYLDLKAGEGDIVGIRKFEITLDDDIKSLHQKSDIASAALLREYLPLIQEGEAPRTSQKELEGNFTKARKEEDGLIDWNQPTLSIYNWIRAQTKPFLGAFTHLNGQKIKVWKARYTNFDISGSKEGEIVESDKDGIKVKTIDGSILCTLLESNDQGKTNAEQFAQENNLKAGDILG
jgi:methionyl-tRNA formyltransferase